MENKYYLGIDLGGSFVKTGLVDEKANVIEKKMFSTTSFNTKEKLLGQIIKTAKEIINKDLKRQKQISGIGIGMPGQVNFEKGFIYKLTNISGWENTAVAKILKKEIGLSVLVDNDVNVTTLGEYLFGAGKGARNMICVALGTGVGGGLIIEGNLYRGSSYSAGEIGHFPIKEKGVLCNCGRRGCLERYIGNRYFIKDIIKRMKFLGKGKKILELADKKFENITPKIITKAAKEGDELAVEAWKNAACKLAMVLGGLVNVLNPDVIVVGGGLSDAGKFLFKPLKQALERFSLKIPFSTVKIRKARLKNNSGIIGAASLFFTDSLCKK